VSLVEFFPHLVVDHDESLDGASGAAVFSPDRVYRYALIRRWDTSKNLLAWVMCNPSTADAFTDDPTIRRCRRFSQQWGYGGLLVVNVFGLRATDPKVLRSHPDPVGTDNDDVVSWHLSHEGPAIGKVVAAWGVNGALNDRGRHMAGWLADNGADVRCLGVTDRGHPRHPLYVSGASWLQPYRSTAGEVAR
jgi:hypothetical protein